ncbi:hypothetical protein FD18_GL001754 [Lactobacillus taiwanensis DSM 21401]|jgi:hypothetical protein|uniref:CopG family transcriptional regulator n=1 Tax=Lactobacillus taiwanensis TaxID=508451 RepID=A0A256LD63_9LACO|nr:hypothetical protein [Lactobacillus taiwanensis]KRM99421.1 hypothetical protein FD18_GL001754 [Lactobacillus taiwanensis DSM 21401]MCR1904195.1 hypothetical protein [Lactobacillus taiwanensis]MRM99144.1 hypothetical protein [Lactobacillus taiwanensis]OYR87901.1 hypothetical protein CBF53_05075 [Lactobacillus taiwanensis]OYR90862.1 hypothetical protein CBF59_07320 [Lactobacillus taiwanensis]
MSKRSFSITDKNNRLLNYYLNRSDKDWNLVINEAIKNYVCDHLSQKQIQEAIKHTGKDAFPADEVLRNFNSSWMNGDA